MAKVFLKFGKEPAVYQFDEASKTLTPFVGDWTEEKFKQQTGGGFEQVRHHTGLTLEQFKKNVGATVSGQISLPGATQTQQQQVAPQQVKATFLGGDNIPAFELTGANVAEVERKASEGIGTPEGAKVNPFNLYGAGFQQGELSEIEQARLQAVKEGQPFLDLPQFDLGADAGILDTKQLLETFSEMQQAQTKTLQDFMNQFQSFQQQEALEPVEPVSLVEEYEQLVEEHDLDKLKNRLSKVREDIETKRTESEKRALEVEQQKIPMAAIEQRLSAEERALRLDLKEDILLEQSLAAQIATKEKTINTIMGLTQQDWQNSQQYVDAQYQRNKDFLESARSIIDTNYQRQKDALQFMTNIEQFEWKVKQDAKDNAQVLWKTVFDLAQSRNIQWDALDKDSKESLEQLEIAAGMPGGLTRQLAGAISPEQEFLHWSADDAGNSYAWVQTPSGIPEILTFPGTARTGAATPQINYTPIFGKEGAERGQVTHYRVFNKNTGETYWIDAQTQERVSPADVPPEKEIPEPEPTKELRNRIIRRLQESQFLQTPLNEQK